jgi:orotidine-5'-phosphate decarboxylase
MIIDRLIDRIIKLGNPTVVGLDPTYDMLPSELRSVNTADSFFEFNKGIIDSVYDMIPAVKPQIAMYEMYGADGIKAYKDTVDYAKSKGLIVIGDIKRSDIGNTAAAYSSAHIGRVKVGENEYKPMFDTDFVTLSPYLGTDTFVPFVEDCEKYDKGLFILLRTSNPNGGEIQNLTEKAMCGILTKLGEGKHGKHGYSPYGAVVGATHPEQGARLRKELPNTFFLIPGYGAQGGKAEDLRVYFENGISGIVNSSRGITEAYKNVKYSDNYAEAARQAVIDMKNDIGKYL